MMRCFVRDCLMLLQFAAPPGLIVRLVAELHLLNLLLLLEEFAVPRVAARVGVDDFGAAEELRVFVLARRSGVTLVYGAV